MTRFALIWLGAAVLGILSVPNLHLHYALPMLVPLALASAPILARPITGSVGFVTVMTISFDPFAARFRPYQAHDIRNGASCPDDQSP